MVFYPAFYSLATAAVVALGSNALAAESVIHRFAFAGAGAEPFAPLFADGAGALYGSTQYAGLGEGTLFKLTPPATPGGAWAYTVIHKFSLTHPDCGQLHTRVITDASGSIYGICGGGKHDAGEIFKLTPLGDGTGNWSETILYNFTGGADGGGPESGLIEGTDGAFYGTTSVGGANNLGTAFKLAPPATGATKWTESVIYSFAGGRDGATPYAGLTIGPEGSFYGATTAGGGLNYGTAFQLTPPSTTDGTWTETVLYRFHGKKDGTAPGATLTLGPDGSLYGTTSLGGGATISISNPGSGTIFKLTPPSKAGAGWTETTLHNFGYGVYGATPSPQLVISKSGVLYGTTPLTRWTKDGKDEGNGVVFKVTPPTKGAAAWTYSVIHHFTGPLDGAFPMSGVIFNTDGNLYGTTEIGGNSVNAGTVFKITP